MGDAFLVFERFGWTLADVEDMEWSDFLDITDAVRLMYEREAKAREIAARP